VVGAGIGGLLAGRVLIEYFDRVTILERDASPYLSADRKGVPQGRHLHSLATRGGEILERYFPNLDAELADAGCPALDQAWDTYTDTPAGRLPRFHSGITMRAVSRSLLEERVRNRLEAQPGVRFLAGREVVGLVPDDTGGAVAGVRTRRRGFKEAEEVLTADLVVDASGQGSRAPRWLEELAFDAPEEEVVDARLGYATRWFRVPEDFSDDWKGLAVLPGWPDDTRGGTLRQVEGDVWTVVLIGLGGDYPPTRGGAYLEFARTLSSPAIYDAIKDAEPVSPVYGYRRTANRRRRYERTRLPENLLVTGDAACSLNPSYGSGMTAAALSAEALERCLHEQCLRFSKHGLAGLGRRFHKRQAAAVAPCWKVTTSTDQQWSASSVDELGLIGRLIYRVSEEILALAVEREDVARTLLEVKNLLEPPSTLLRPGILFPALWRAALSTFAKRDKPGSPTKPKKPPPKAKDIQSTSGWLALSYGEVSPEQYGPFLDTFVRVIQLCSCH
jgi:2-polyprenyl-6-methoxyphenol hydroxylase-like FAD-dependent oxidoreductase